MKRLQRPTRFAALFTIAALAAIVGGLSVIGSPNEIRMRRFDVRRGLDLTLLASAITSYRRTHEGLPQTLQDLQTSTQAALNIKDPRGRAYEYAVRDAFHYELCAEFETAADGHSREVRPRSS